VVVYRCDWAFPHLIDQVLSDRPKLHLAERKRIVTAGPLDHGARNPQGGLGCTLGHVNRSAGYFVGSCKG
jgi:hypothetical protein